MFKLRQMLIFIAVVDHGTFAAAAEALDISVVAVSKQISQLEKLCQQTLFNRSTRAMLITDFGKEYYKACKKVTSAMQGVETLVESQSEQLQGCLKLHGPVFFVAHFILPVLSKFIHQHPKLDVCVTTGDTPINMLEHDIDILLGYTPETMASQQNLRCCNIFESENILAASPSYLKEFGLPRCKKDLYKHRFIHDIHLEQPLKIKFNDGETLTDLSTALALGDRRLMCLAALQDIGILYTAKRTIFPELISGELVEILPSSLAEKTCFSAFYRYSAINSVKIQKFLERLMIIVKAREHVISNSVLPKAGHKHYLEIKKQR